MVTVACSGVLELQSQPPHECVHSSHTNPPEAVVGALERELVMSVGSGRGRTLTKDQKTKLRDYTAAEKAAATPP